MRPSVCVRMRVLVRAGHLAPQRCDRQLCVLPQSQSLALKVLKDYLPGYGMMPEPHLTPRNSAPARFESLQGPPLSPCCLVHAAMLRPRARGTSKQHWQRRLRIPRFCAARAGAPHYDDGGVVLEAQLTRAAYHWGVMLLEKGHIDGVCGRGIARHSKSTAAPPFLKRLLMAADALSCLRRASKIFKSPPPPAASGFTPSMDVLLGHETGYAAAERAPT